MNWNNDKLNEIQAIEDNLIFNANCGSNSVLFTNFIHSTSEWIDKENNAKEIHISPYKVQLDMDVELVAYYIETGLITDDAIAKVCINRDKFYENITDTHRIILKKAMVKRTKNRNNN